MAFCYKFHVLSSVQFFSHEIFGGGLQIFLPVRLKEFRRGVQCHYFALSRGMK